MNLTRDTVSLKSVRITGGEVDNGHTIARRNNSKELKYSVCRDDGRLVEYVQAGLPTRFPYTWPDSS